MALRRVLVVLLACVPVLAVPAAVSAAVRLPGPDRGLIAYTQSTDAVMGVPAGGGKPVVLLRAPSGSIAESPSWSPDGRRIAFDAFLAGASGPFVLVVGNPATGAMTQLPIGRLDAIDPAWSPSGDRIAFAGRPRNGSWQIYTIAADGSALRRVTHDHGDDRHPAWSADCSTLVYDRDDGAALSGSSAEVRILLAHAGCRLGSRTYVRRGGLAAGTVVGQSPKPGTALALGAPVSVVLVK